MTLVTGIIDYDACGVLAKAYRPKILIAGMANPDCLL
jgi:glycine/serine hydroxymethyltransferase